MDEGRIERFIWSEGFIKFISIVCVVFCSLMALLMLIVIISHINVGPATRATTANNKKLLSKELITIAALQKTYRKSTGVFTESLTDLQSVAGPKISDRLMKSSINPDIDLSMKTSTNKQTVVLQGETSSETEQLFSTSGEIKTTGITSVDSNDNISSIVYRSE